MKRGAHAGRENNWNGRTNVSTQQLVKGLAGRFWDQHSFETVLPLPSLTLGLSCTIAPTARVGLWHHRNLWAEKPRLPPTLSPLSTKRTSLTGPGRTHRYRLFCLVLSRKCEGQPKEEPCFSGATEIRKMKGLSWKKGEAEENGIP